MIARSFGRWTVGLVCLAVSVACAAAHAETADDALKTASDAWEKHNYKDALEAYRGFLKLAPDGEKPREAGLRIAIALGKLEQWDEALKEASAYAEKYPNTVWQARGCYVLGKLLADMPHYGWKKGSEVTRGRQQVQGAQYVYMYKEDRDAAIAAFERSREVYLKFANELDALPAEARAAYLDERIAVNFELAAVLSREYEWGWRNRWQGGEIKPLAASAAYPSAAVDVEEKVVFLFDEIAKLDKSEKRESAALARYRKAMFFANRYNLVSGQATPVTPERDSFALLRDFEKDYPKSGMVDEVRYALGRLHQMKGGFLEAERIYNGIAKDFPQSPRAIDAQAQIQEINWKDLNFGNPAAFMPGTAAKMALSSRNVKEAALTIERLKLDKLVADSSEWAKGDNDLSRLLWSRQAALANYTDGTVAEWKHATSDKADHRGVTDELELPVKEIGAYLVTAKADGLTARNIVLVTDLAIMKKTGQNEAVVVVADATTGAPVAGADVTVGEWFYDREGRWQFRSSTGKLPEDGIYRFKRTADRNRGWGGNVQAFATAGERRYALTTTSWWNSWGRSDTHRIYCYTDRPVYRPGQTVHFKQIIRRETDGQFANVAGAPLRIKIRNPKGEYVYDRTVNTSDTGCIEGELLLGDEPPLGVWYIETRQPNDQWFSANSQGNMFRVEEYKKPEFEVTVEPDKDQVKLGGQVTAKIRGKYYFGAPVTQAKAKYRVFRDAYYHDYIPAGRFDWLYGSGYGYRRYWDQWYQPRSASSGELVKEGEGALGADGALAVSFDTADAKTRWPDVDHSYRIEAEVTDASRRTIQGSGRVLVTRTQFYLYATVENGFYRPGDKVKVELSAMTPDGSPLEVPGKAEVYAVKYEGAQNDKETAKLVQTVDVKTDAAGRAFIAYQSDESSQFKVVFKAKDGWGGDVEGVGRFWIAGEDFSGEHFRFRDVEILTDKRSYAKGETAHLMVNSNFADTHVLLTSEVKYDLMSVDLLHLAGRSKQFDIKLGDTHAPNFFVQAALVRNGQVFNERQEIFVPPAEKFLDVSVTSSKPRYLPGETGEFTVKVTDAAGKPADAEVSMAVFDRSVLYIQTAFAPEIRKFFYGDRRGGPVNLWHSFQLHFSGVSANDNKRQEFKTHGEPADWGYYGRGGPGGQQLEQSKSNLREAEFLGEGGQGEFGARAGGGRREMKAAAAPMAADAAAAPGEMRKGGMDGLASAPEAKDKDEKAASGGAAEPAFVAAEVRSKFADTAYWKGVIPTGADGVETVKVTFPDNLTTWQADAKAVTRSTEVGQAAASVITSKNLLVRMQSPRFFVETDEVVLSANVHNYLKTEKTVRCQIELPKDGLLATAAPLSVDVKVPAGGEKRLDWRVNVRGEGLAVIKMSALSDEESDAVQMSFPAFIHGAEKFVAANDSYRVDQEGRRVFTLDLPKEINPAATELELVMQPSMAGAMLDALPYLLEYPYGCTEQTMSRFLPAVVVSKSLADMGVSLEEIGKKKKQLSERAIEKIGFASQHGSDWQGPVYSTEKMQDIVRSGLGRLYSFQHSDGGWGWWKEGSSDPYMSAYVLYGLSTAKKAGFQVEPGRMKSAVGFLLGALKEDLKQGGERQAYIAFALSSEGAKDAAALDKMYEKRDGLNLYGKSLLALALHNLGDAQRADIVMQNIEQFLERDKRAGTAWLPLKSNRWWYWYNNDVETNAYALRAAAAIHPKAEYLPDMAKWLVGKREGARWSSTKETAMCVYALADYMKQTGELQPDYEIAIDLDGVTKKVRVDRDTMFSFDNVFKMLGDDVAPGKHKLTISKSGQGALYLGCYLKYFTKEQGIKGAGSGLNVKRTYSKLIPKRTKVVTARGEEERLDYDRVEIKDGDVLKSGDEVEVKLDIASDNDYEYLVFEDMKPAGCEPVELRSGMTWGDGLGTNMELRDEKVAFFISWLAQGKQTISYRMRAEIPGLFHALPTNAFAMYAPKVRAISDEKILRIEDAGE